MQTVKNERRKNKTMISIKKVMAGVLVAAMALSFTACSNSKKTEPEASAISKPLTSASPKTSSSPKATATPKATAKPTEKPKATQTPAPTQAPTATPAPTQAPTAAPEPTQVPEQTTDSGFSEQDARNLLAMPCHILNTLDDESYDVDYDSSMGFKGYWETQDDVGTYDPNGLVPEDEISDDTPTSAGTYFLVTSASSNEEVRNHLLEYMSYDVLDQLYGTPTFDYDGNTYLLRGGRGYYQVDRDFNDATITDLTDTSFTATMDCYEWDQYMGTCTVNMSKDGSAWYIVGYSQNF